MNHLLLKEATFKVEGIGNFWTLFKNDAQSLFYAEFENVPPHYHKHTEELFFILNGKATATIGTNFSEYEGDSITEHYGISDPITDKIKEDIGYVWANRRIRDLGPNSSLRIKPYTPHMLEVKKAPLEVILLNIPPIDKFNPIDDYSLPYPDKRFL